MAAAVGSILGYLQHIGALMDNGDWHVPSGIKRIVELLTRFFSFLAYWLPQIPDFDQRVTLALVGCLVPFGLNLLIMWFLQPIWKFCLHVIDVAALGVVSCVAAHIAVRHESVLWQRLVVAACVLWIAWRLVWLFFQIKKRLVRGQWNYCDIGEIICDFTLGDWCGNLRKNVDEDELRAAVVAYNSQYDSNIDWEAETGLPWVKLCLLPIGFVVFLVISLICTDVIPTPHEIPAMAQTIVPIFSFPIAFLCVLVFVLQLFQAGRKCWLNLGIFCKRWGMRLLILGLDVLYLPVLTAMLGCIVLRTQDDCVTGQYLVVNYNTTEIFAPFVARNYTCEACTITTGICESICNETKPFMVTAQDGLMWGHDVIRAGGGLLLYGIVIVMLGLPGFYYHVISENAEFMSKINIWGKTAERKWRSLSTRLWTTGIWFFCYYRQAFHYWGLLLMGCKVLIVLFTGLAALVKGWIEVFVPLVYLAMCLATWHFKPYVRGLNTWLDVTCFACNTLFSFVPILGVLGVKVPEMVCTVLALMITVLPLASIAVLMFFQIVRADDVCGDPTLEKELSEEETARRAQLIQALRIEKEELQEKREKRSQERSPLMMEKGMMKMGAAFASNAEEDELLSGLDDVTIEVGMLDSIDQLKARQRAKEGRAERVTEVEHASIRLDTDGAGMFVEDLSGDTVVADRLELAHQTHACLDLIDIVMDGNTISKLTLALNVAALSAALAVGWFLGVNAYASADLTPCA